MSRACTLAVVAVAVYEVVALRTGKLPSITAVEKGVRSHFRPHCVGCQCNGRVPRRVVHREGRAWP